MAALFDGRHPDLNSGRLYVSHARFADSLCVHRQLILTRTQTRKVDVRHHIVGLETADGFLAAAQSDVHRGWVCLSRQIGWKVAQVHGPAAQRSFHRRRNDLNRDYRRSRVLQTQQRVENAERHCLTDVVARI